MDPPFQDSFVLYGVGSDTSVLLARLSTGNTGFLDGQLTTRVVYIEQSGASVQHRAQYGVATRDADGISAGPDALRHTPRGWDLRVGGTGVQISLELADAGSGCPPRPGRVAGGLGLTTQDAVAPTGQMSSSGGSLLRGQAVVVPHHTTTTPVGDTLYVFSPTFSMGVDPLAPCPAWVIAGDTSWTGPAVALPRPAGEFELGEWRLKVRPAGPPVTVDSGGHLHPLERFLAGLVGVRPGVEVVRRVSVKVEGPGAAGPRTGLLVTRDASSDGSTPAPGPR